MKRASVKKKAGMDACICGSINIVWFPAAPDHWKWYCPKCGIICRTNRNLELELKAVRERENRLKVAQPALPDSFKPWKVYGNGVRMIGYREEEDANAYRDRQRLQQPEGKFWVQWEITADDAGLEAEPERDIHTVIDLDRERKAEDEKEF